jgi:hypothetical protein
MLNLLLHLLYIYIYVYIYLFITFREDIQHRIYVPLFETLNQMP